MTGRLCIQGQSVHATLRIKLSPGITVCWHDSTHQIQDQDIWQQRRCGSVNCHGSENNYCSCLPSFQTCGGWMILLWRLCLVHRPEVNHHWPTYFLYAISLFFKPLPYLSLTCLFSKLKCPSPFSLSSYGSPCMQQPSLFPLSAFFLVSLHHFGGDHSCMQHSRCGVITFSVLFSIPFLIIPNILLPFWLLLCTRQMFSDNPTIIPRFLEQLQLMSCQVFSSCFH